MSEYSLQDLITKAKEARDLGDKDLEAHILEKAKALKDGQSTGNFSRGFIREAQKQLIGGTQLVNDAYLAATGNPKSENRIRLDEKGRQLNAEAAGAPWQDTAGSMILGGGEFAALPGVETRKIIGEAPGAIQAAKGYITSPDTLHRVAQNSLLGGILNALTPAESGADRADNSMKGVAWGGIIPEAIGGAGNAVKGVFNMGRNIVNPTRAAAQEVKDTLEKIGAGGKFDNPLAVPLKVPDRGTGAELPSDFPVLGDGVGPPLQQQGPPRPRFSYITKQDESGNIVPGVSPTPAQLDPAFRDLERNARVRMPSAFTRGRDEPNLDATWRALANHTDSADESATKLAELDSITKSKRDEAFNILHGNAINERKQADSLLPDSIIKNQESMLSAPKESFIPSFARPIKDTLTEFSNKPGTRTMDGLTVLKSDFGKPFDNIDDLHPDDLYTIIKEKINHRLARQAVSPEDVAVKDSMMLNNALKKNTYDEWNSQTDGLWNDYLATYQHGMEDINSGHAMRKIIEPFFGRKIINNTDKENIVPLLTRGALNQGDNAHGWKEIGAPGAGQKEVDQLLPQARGTFNDSLDFLQSLESAKDGAIAVSGAPTASYGWNAAQSVVGSDAPWLIKAAKYGQLLSRLRGMEQLDLAVAKPESGRLQEILDVLNSGKVEQPPMAIEAIMKLMHGLNIEPAAAGSNLGQFSTGANLVNTRNR